MKTNITKQEKIRRLLINKTSYEQGLTIDEIRLELYPVIELKGVNVRKIQNSWTRDNIYRAKKAKGLWFNSIRRRNQYGRMEYRYYNIEKDGPAIEQVIKRLKAVAEGYYRSAKGYRVAHYHVKMECKGRKKTDAGDLNELR